MRISRRSLVSSEHPQGECSPMGGPIRPLNSMSWMKWRGAYISGSKPIQVGFNRVYHLFPYKKVHF